MIIRDCEASDLPALNDLYNGFIENSPATFDVDPWSIERRTEWLSHYGASGRHRALVATTDEHEFLGYATSSPFRPKDAYQTSVETSIYICETAHGQGVARALYTRLFELLATEDIHRAYAGVTMPNDASIALHEQFGFVRVAYFSEQGRKFGRYWDVAWFEKAL